MDAEVKVILAAVKKAIGLSDTLNITENVDFEQLYKISKRHSIANVVGYGLSDVPGVPDEQMELFKKEIHAHMLISENQRCAVEELFNAFDEKNIVFCPLKGLVLKKLYPSEDMRSMSDADILINRDQFDDADAIMSLLKYTYLGESNHEYNYFRAPIMRVELHKYLIPSYNIDMYSYYESGWDLAVQDEHKKNHFLLNVNDEYIFTFAHLAKHYRDSGIGFRAFIDIQLFRNKHKLDYDYVNSQLKKINLFDFHNSVMELLDVWFCDKEPTPLSEDMTDYIVGSGVFGTKANAASVFMLRENKNVRFASKLRYLNLVVPRFKYMKISFPILEEYPILLPVLWVYRWFRCLFFRRENICVGIDNVKGASISNIYSFEAHMKSVGIDVYNGRKK